MFLAENHGKTNGFGMFWIVGEVPQCQETIWRWVNTIRMGRWTSSCQLRWCHESSRMCMRVLNHTRSRADPRLVFFERWTVHNCTGANLDITSVRNDLETGNWRQQFDQTANLEIPTLHIYYWWVPNPTAFFPFCNYSTVLPIVWNPDCSILSVLVWSSVPMVSALGPLFAAALPGTPGIHAEAEGQIWWVPGCLGQYRVWKLVCDGRVDILKCDEVCWSPASTRFFRWVVSCLCQQTRLNSTMTNDFYFLQGLLKLETSTTNQWSPKPRLMSSASSLLMSLRNLQPKLSLHARRNLLRRQRHAVDGIYWDILGIQRFGFVGKFGIHTIYISHSQII